MTGAPNNDPVDRARRALWAARKLLDATLAGGTIVPGLGGVYADADRAYSASTVACDVAVAHERAQHARQVLRSCAIDADALEQRLAAHDGDLTIEEYLDQVRADLDTVAADLAAPAEEGF